ncbi:hypothetical protein B0H14DRAFT_3710968 [Mycena olivaceomarginata]|nr:hypothetical protein B0H14DRAFT_3710968 [Mycena olivaceomarginata]
MPRKQLSQLHSSPLICLEAGPREKAGGGVKWMGVLRCASPNENPRLTVYGLGLPRLRCKPTSRASGRELALATIFPPYVRQSPASSDAPDAFSTVSIPHTACAATGSAARCPGGHLQHHDSARDPLRARSTVPATLTGSTPRRREHKPELHYRPRAQHATPRRPPAHGSVLPSPTDTCACRTPQHHLHRLLRAQRVRWSFPTAGTAFIASSRAEYISSKYHSPRSTRAQGACMHDPSRAQHLRQPLPIPRATVFISLPAATVSSASLSSALSQLLSGTGSTTRSIAEVRSKCNERSPSPTPPSSPGTAPIFSADARDRSKPWPAAHREQDAYHLPCAAHAAAVPPSPHTLPASPVHPQSCTAPLADDSARRLPVTSAGCVCRDDSATGWRGTDHTEAMRTPCFHRYPPSVLGISDKRGRAPRTILDPTNLGGDSRTCAPPGISDRTAACAAQISGERCEHGDGCCGNVGDVPIRTHIT